LLPKLFYGRTVQPVTCREHVVLPTTVLCFPWGTLKQAFFFNSFHGKAEMEHQSDVRTCVLFVYGDMYYDTALFFKNCVIL